MNSQSARDRETLQKANRDRNGHVEPIREQDGIGLDASSTRSGSTIEPLLRVSKGNSCPAQSPVSAIPSKMIKVFFRHEFSQT